MFKIWGSHSDDNDEYSDVMSCTVEEISTLRDVTSLITAISFQFALTESFLVFITQIPAISSLLCYSSSI